MRGLRVYLDALPGWCRDGVVLWEDGRIDVDPDFDRFVRSYFVSKGRHDAGEYWHAEDFKALRRFAGTEIAPAGARLRIRVRHGGSLLPSPTPWETFKMCRVEWVEGPDDGTRAQ